MRLIIILFFLFSFVFTVPIVAMTSDDEINYGLWEILIETNIQGMTEKMPIEVIKNCIAKDKLIAGVSKGQDECKVTTQSTKGNVITWEGLCKNKNGNIKFGGKSTYRDNNMSGTTYFTDHIRGVTIKSTITGKRLGDC